jgi:hypothetical protein
MAQHDYNIANQGFPAFRTDLNNALSAIQTTNSGTSRPTGAVAGQLWLDTTSATTPTLKYYDGADDISLATIDHTANTVNWLDSTVSITGLSTTATGTVLTLTDSASTSTVNLIIDNQKEIRFRETTANGTNYVALKAPASLSADLTFTLPSADGTSGQVLQTNGSGVLSFATVGSLAWQTIITGATLSAVAGRGYWINTTSNACTVTLPASASNGDTIILADYLRTWGTNKITINSNSLKFQGNTSPNPEYNTNGQSVTLVYSGATQGWIPTVDDDVTLETPQTVDIDFLVVAGGGGGGRSAEPGGYHSGAGGGAGGFRTSTQTSNLGVAITVTVGDGGTGSPSAPSGTSPSVLGGTGSNSSISGSGLTTITSAGGGGGANAGIVGGNGGSGGGSASTTGGSGNTPSTSPSQGNNGGSGNNNAPYHGAGGGGGASAVGGNGTTTVGANGGAGTASSITGSSVTYSGGGGGGTYDGGTSGTGGTGGGGNAGAAGGANNGSNGTANTGGGGGGSSSHGPSEFSAGGNGGKGVVILSMLTSKYSGTTTGSPTVTTKNAGADTVLTFTGSGSYTT